MNLNKDVFSICCVLFCIFNCNAQIQPDSLIGTYVGEYWYSEWNNPWEIFENDTVWVYSIDTENCTLEFGRSFNEPFGYFGGLKDFETAYDFCNGTSLNFYKRFYGSDSLAMRIDNISPPPPNYKPVSIRFYGKKISSDILTVIHSIPLESNCILYPNPFQNEINIAFKDLKNRSVRLLNADGKIVFYGDVTNQNYLIPTNTLSAGMYLLQIITNDSIDNFKIIKQ
jgi:hypothetical protein